MTMDRVFTAKLIHVLNAVIHRATSQKYVCKKIRKGCLLAYSDALTFTILYNGADVFMKCQVLSVLCWPSFPEIGAMGAIETFKIRFCGIESSKGFLFEAKVV